MKKIRRGIVNISIYGIMALNAGLSNVIGQRLWLLGPRYSYFLPFETTIEVGNSGFNRLHQ